jgi:predicted amidohydrolase YtcJ
MIEARDTALAREWIQRGPRLDPRGMLTVRAIKAFADGALGSRGARLLTDYTDAPGQRGVTETFDHRLVAAAMDAGFQAAVHAIGDAANRETLDFFDSVFASRSATRALRNRIEHAQVLAPADIPRFARSGVVASMQPPHAVEDMGWAEQRLGPERVRGAYAWRSLRKAGARLVFSSDLPGTDHNIFYGLHSAITRETPALQPPGGWYREQDMTSEEAVLGYTAWAAWAQHLENRTGVLERGRWADVSAMDVDPFVLGRTAPERLLGGKILLTVVAGRVVFEAKR